MTFNIRSFSFSTGVSPVLCVIRAKSWQDAHQTAMTLMLHNLYMLELVQR
jgi:hypothetical protein